MKTLLLTQLPPNHQYTASIVLDGFCRQLPLCDLVNVVLLNPYLADIKKSATLDMPTLYLEKPLESGIRPRRYMTRVTNFASWARNKYRMRVFSGLLRRAVEFGKKHRVEAVWAQLDTPATIIMAASLAKALGVPLFTMVFDVPEWYMKEYGMAPRSIREVSERFADAIRSSACCATASDPMALEYAERYKVRTVTVQHAFDSSCAQKPVAAMRESDIFRIGMSGQLYAQDSWQKLLALLNCIGWRIKGRRVSIRLLGRDAAFLSTAPASIEYLGWHSQTEAVRLLSECDMLYCPYSFSPYVEDVSRLSFPSKIPGYLAAARPILVHAPEYSSVAKFFRKTDTALVCPSLLESALLNEITRLFDEPGLYGRVSEGSLRTLHEYFSLETMRNKLEEFFRMDNA